ncbi:NUDIX domain-containing protein [Haloimpatiens sp. FM7330]|uniref:NUDIX domain-containing protein n=1 Tax=Haloimpatiens sp. FM7330 TaxID=3298610 RepID=UPI00362A8040
MVTESTEDTARREVFEETGLTVGKLKLIDVFSGQGSYIKVPNGDEFYSVTVAYYTKEISGDFKIDESESLEFRYISIHKIPENIVKSHKKMIDRFLKIYNEK